MLRTAELGYNVIKGTEYFVSLLTSVIITEEYNVMVNGGKLIDTIKYLTLLRRCRINWCRYNGVRQYLQFLRPGNTINLKSIITIRCLIF